MRRNILIFLGLLVALLPYLGFPYEYNKWVWTLAGFLIVFLVLLPRAGKIRQLERLGDRVGFGGHGEQGVVDMQIPRSLHVERRETEDRSGVHIERKTIVDTKHITESPTSDTVVEKKVSVVRRRKQQSGDTPPPAGLGGVNT